MRESSRKSVESQKERLYGVLKQLAIEASPGSKLPTVRQMVDLYGVSQTTVTAALARLSEQRIIERRDRSGIYAVEAPQGGRLLILCEAGMFISGSPFWEMLLEALLSPHQSNPGCVTVRFLNPQLRARSEYSIDDLLTDGLKAQVFDRFYDCVVMIGGNEQVAFDIQAAGIPVVSYAVASRYNVISAGLEATQLGVAELVRMGCSRIALFDAPSISIKEVLMASLASHGAEESFIPFDEGWDYDPTSILPHQRVVERGFYAGRRILDHDPRPDGVVLSNDMFAQGFCMGLVSKGRVPGDDFQIATQTNKNSPVLLAWHDRLVRFEMDVDLIAGALLSAVSALQKGEKPSKGGWDRAIWQPGGGGGSYTYLIRTKLIPRLDKCIDTD